MLLNRMLLLFSKGANMVLLKVWGAENGPWMQALHCIFGCGSLVGVLLATPFLKSELGVKNSFESFNVTWKPENSSVVYQKETGMMTMLSHVAIAKTTVNPSVQQNDLTELVVANYDSQVHWAYLIIGLCLCFSAFLFVLLTFLCSEIKLQCCDKNKKSPEQNVKEEPDEPKNERVFRLKLTIIVFFFYLSYCILQTNYGNYLSTYTVKDLAWTEQEGARLTSGYWATFTLGQALGIVLVKVNIGFLFISLVYFAHN